MFGFQRLSIIPLFSSFHADQEITGRGGPSRCADWIRWLYFNHRRACCTKANTSGTKAPVDLRNPLEAHFDEEPPFKENWVSEWSSLQLEETCFTNFPVLFNRYKLPVSLTGSLWQTGDKKQLLHFLNRPLILAADFEFSLAPKYLTMRNKTFGEITSLTTAHTVNYFGQYCSTEDRAHKGKLSLRTTCVVIYRK